LLFQFGAVAPNLTQARLEPLEIIIEPALG
jgi:hypothetical protein